MIVMDEDFKAMKSHGVPRGRHSPPFLLIGLVVVIVILGLNYWSVTTQLGDLQQQDDELRRTFRDELQLKKELQANNEMLESRVKKSQETYDGLKQSLDKKEEEALQCKETLVSSKQDFNIVKSADEQKIVDVEEKLRRAKDNITQQLQIHEQDGSLVVSLREENAKLSAQLSALRESLNHTPPPLPSAAAATAATAASSSTADCNLHCLILVEAAQKRLFKKIAAKYGEDALAVLESADFGIPRRPGKLLTGAPPAGKLAEDILVVERDGKIVSGGEPPRLAPSDDNDNDNDKDSPQFLPAKPSSTTPSSLITANVPLEIEDVVDQPPLDGGVEQPRPLDEIAEPRPLNGVANVEPRPLNGVANVGAAPLDLDDQKLVNLDAAVADAAGAAAVAPKPPMMGGADDEDGRKMREDRGGRVDDVVDGDAETSDDEDDAGAAAAAVDGQRAQAQQEPLLVAAAPPMHKDGIDQLHNNLAAAENNNNNNDDPLRV